MIVIHTFTGKSIDPLAPRREDICIEDIAHALAHQCRFGGHVRAFYSVAQHSVIVSYLCESADALSGLLHDASEAYLVDLPRPIKHRAPLMGYRAAEALLQAFIYAHFGLDARMPPSVHAADDGILVNEARDLFLHAPQWAVKGTPLPLRGKPIEPWAPDVAERKFLARFVALTTKEGTAVA